MITVDETQIDKQKVREVVGKTYLFSDRLKLEKEFYKHRATSDWLKDLEPLGTDENKPFLEHAPHLIVIFQKKY